LLRVSYRGSARELKVDYDVSGQGSFHECYSGTVDLPTGYFLGVTAATGGVSDNQDVNFLEFRRLGTAESDPSAERTNPWQKQQEEKTDKEIDNLKQEIDALRKANAAGNAPKPTDLPPEDIAGRISLLEEQLKQIETKVGAVAKVAGGIDALSKSVELLKQRVDNNDKPSASYDVNQLRSELSKQQQELNRVASKAQESIVSVVDERMANLERSTQNLRGRVDELSLASKKTGGGFMNILMIIVMVIESCLLLVLFMKGRKNANKYDKMW